MSIWKDLATKSAVPIAALLTFALVGCATSPPPTQPSQAAAASPSAQPTAQSTAQAAQTKTAHKKLTSRHKAAKTGSVLVLKRKASKPVPGLATSIEPANPPATASLSAGNTASVLSRLHHDDLAEIALAKVAEEKTTSPEVRSYADQLISDHLAVDQTVLAMAQKTGVRLREPATAPQNSIGAKADGKPAATSKSFDKGFLQQTSSDHERMINKLKKDREDASNDDVEALIDKVMPIFQQDQQLARILMNKERAS